MWSCFDRQSLNVTVVQLLPSLSTCPWNIPLSCFRSVLIQKFFPLKSVKSLVEVMGPPHAASNGELAAPLIGAMIASAFVSLLLASLFSLKARSSTGCMVPWYVRRRGISEPFRRTPYTWRFWWVGVLSRTATLPNFRVVTHRLCYYAL